ncbi:MAG: DUF2459 domain-containing protein [Planctomycetota bacterium]
MSRIGRAFGRLPRPLRWLAYVVAAIALFGLLYQASAEIGERIPVNADAEPLAGDIDVYLVTNGVHVDIWVGAARPERDWVAWLPDEVPARSFGYVAFGWGDEAFYLEVPTWDDLTVGVALRGALLPTRSAMHVKAFVGPPRRGDSVHLVRLTSEEYGALVEYIDAGFALDEAGRPVLLDHPGYKDYDRFFRGSGHYHLFGTCNTWTNGAVKAMGRRAALWTPYERGVRRHLPKNGGRG